MAQLVVQVFVEPTGVVKDARVLTAPAEHFHELGPCIVAILRALTFRECREASISNIPFMFVGR